MKIWTFVTQKGGAGKTTLATNLAVKASEKGEKVLLIDIDPQKSASKWWQRRDSDDPLLVDISHDELGEALKMAKKNEFTLVIIDTAGHQHLKQNDAVAKASFCLIPCQPSIADIEAVYPTVDLLKRMKKHFAFVLTRCPAIGQDQQSAREGLSGFGLVCKPYTVERKAYKNAFALGEGVSEFDRVDKSNREVTDLYHWIKAKERKLSHEKQEESSRSRRVKALVC